MTSQPLIVIGLMSGTSVDSVDAACIEVDLNQNPVKLGHYKLVDTHTQDIPEILRENLLEVMANPTTSLEKLGQLNQSVAVLFAETASVLIKRLHASKIKVDLVASHGQTVFHAPPQAGQLGFTMQIGDPALIAKLTGCKVAADFRPGDMAAGGQGAPLVPFADQLLFQDTTQCRVVQNIGGIANLTFLPPTQANIPLMAFDTGPGNMMMDAASEILFGQPFDQDGQIAARGNVHEPMLLSLMQNPYITATPPKSTGRELFGKSYTHTVIAQWQNSLSPDDILATLTHFTAASIIEACDRFIIPIHPIHQVIVGGGGVLNTTLMNWLRDMAGTRGIALKTHEDYDIPSKYKEAIAFALLGAARLLGIPGNIPSCTGATQPVVLGGLWSP